MSEKLFDLEAEYSVLGTMIVQPSFTFRGVELLTPEDFFKVEHRNFFRFIRDLIAEGYTEKQLNEISFKDELQKRGLLEKVGGEDYLSMLVEYALESYEKFESACKVVKDKALLRRVVDLGKKINDFVEQTPDPDLLIETLEKEVFSLSEDRITNSLIHVGEVIPGIIGQIEELATRREMVTGLPTGFFQLDQMTSGLQPSDLIILAARPSMGKTAFALSIAYNVAVMEGKTVAFFSLEMTKEQLITRLLAQDAKVPLHRIRSGFLKPQEIELLVEAADRISQAPLYIDDTPGISILEMRAKARRLQSERGLDLIIVDYLQLMRGIKRTESRQQEVSEISRSLKALAKELNVPVIALSQLSRQVEHRADKRPQLSDLRESGCLTGDTLIVNADTGERIPIKELVGKSFNTWALDVDLKIRKFRVSKVFPTGEKEVFLLKTRTGREIKATANHSFLTVNGWKELRDLKVGERIATPRRYPEITKPGKTDRNELILLAHLIGDGCVLPRQPIHYTSSDLENIETVKSAAKVLFGIDGKVVKQENWYHVYLSSPYRLTRGKRHPITKLYEKHGLKRVRSYEKELPNTLFRCSKEDIKLFIRHLWATDGSISISGKRASIYYSSSSLKLIKQLQHLLLRLGILTTINKAEKPGCKVNYQLTVIDKLSQVEFLKNIGSAGERGKRAKEVLSEISTMKYNPNYDVIPKEAWNGCIEIARKRAKMSWRELSKRINTAYCGSTLKKSNISRERMQRLFKALQSEQLYYLANSDILWDEIVEIKPIGREKVYDMTVPEVHNFVANDIIAHNSLEQDADIVMFIHRPEFYKKNPDPEEEGIAEIIIAKQRNGPTGPVKLAFIKDLTRFENPDPNLVKTETAKEEPAEEVQPPVFEEESSPPEEDFTFGDDDLFQI